MRAAAWPAVVCGVAAFLRLFRLEWAQYRRDDAIVLGLAQTALTAHHVPWVGMISTLGIDNGPAQVWLAMGGALAGPEPLVAEWLVALLNVVGVAATCAFGREAFGRRVGLSAALLLAVSSWSVLYSRRLWGNDMLAPFAALWLASLARVLRRGDPIHQVLIWIWAALLLQVYVVALAQLPAIGLGVLAALALRRLRPLPTAIGVITFIVLTAPYATRTVLPGLGHLRRLSGGSARATIDATSLRYLGRLVGLDAYQGYLPRVQQALDVHRPPWHWIDLLATALLVGGAVVAAARVSIGARQLPPSRCLPRGGPLRPATGATRWLLAITLLWALVPVLALARHAVDLFPHYLLGAVPAIQVLMALALEEVAAIRPLRWLPAVAVGAVAAAQLVVAAIFLREVPNYVRGTEYGLPLRDVEVLATAARQQGAGGPGGAQLLVVGHYDGAELGEALRTWFPSLDVVDDQESLRLPRGDAPLVVLTTRDDSPMVAFLRDAAPGRVLRFAGDDTVFRLLATSTEQVRRAALTAMPPVDPATLGGDVRLDGSRVPSVAAAGTPLLWASRCTVTDGGAREKPVASIFAHLVTAGGAGVGARDQAFDNHAAAWQAGDTLLAWVSVDIPASATAGDDRVVGGLYRLTPAGIAPLAGPGGAELALGTVTVTATPAAGGGR